MYILSMRSREISFFYVISLFLHLGRINQVQPQGRKRVAKDKLHEKGLKASSREPRLARNVLAGSFSLVLNSVLHSAEKGRDYLPDCNQSVRTERRG